jgi:hypothetical protein
MSLSMSDFDGWVQEGSFEGTDGHRVRAYDDVVLTREIPVRDGVRTTVASVPAGTVGTVLFFVPGPTGLAELELNVLGGFAFGIEETRRLRLHQTNEEKYPR